MHALHLLRSENYRCKADAVVTYRTIELCIGSPGHYIRAGWQSRKGLCNHLFHQTIALTMDIYGLCIVIGMDNFCL